jgi:CHRD domain
METQMTHKLSLVTTAFFALGALSAAPALAETKTFTAELTGASEVPPVETQAKGSAEVTLDTEAKTVMWKVTTEGLSGEPTGAHIHGPAAEGETADPVIDLSASLADGTSEITDEQIAELEGGKYYVNVHTDANPDGEIRGQLMAASQ